MPVVVVDYDPSWPLAFEALRAAIAPELAGVALAIEHVGSTAVPGLSAKPVIDIDVVVPDAEVSAGIARLGQLGYAHLGDLGIPQREAFTAPAGGPRHNLYLCPQSSPALANHLAVRDHLRAHPAVAQAYGALKKQLAEQHADDIGAYIEGKTAFLVSILRARGFAEESLAQIARINQRAIASSCWCPGLHGPRK
jgi:GrpB-like predicted nucleotidyltransferase (UPF0157 family)